MTLHLAELTPRERVGQISQFSVPVAIVAGAALGRLWWHAPLAQPPLKLQRSKPQSSDLHERLRSEEHTSELQSPYDLVCRLLLEKKKPHDRLQILGRRLLSVSPSHAFHHRVTA